MGVAKHGITRANSRYCTLTSRKRFKRGDILDGVPSWTLLSTGVDRSAPRGKRTEMKWKMKKLQYRVRAEVKQRGRRNYLAYMRGLVSDT